MLSRVIRDSFQNVAERFHLTLKNCPTHPSNCTKEWITSDLTKGKAYYILEDHTPVGCVALEKASQELYYLERLAVLPKQRRKGFGRLLVDHVFQEVRRRGGNIICIAIINEHVELKRWYECIGFRVMETKIFPHLPFVVTFMEIRLPQTL